MKKECPCKKVCTFFESDLTPLEKGLLVSTAFLGGLALGFLLSPRKKGLAIGSHNGCGNVVTQEEDED